jgi:hypothetical protein
MMSHFMGYGVSQLRVSGCLLLLLEDIDVIECDTAWILHGTPIVLGTEHGIILGELIGHSKVTLIECHTLCGYFENEVLELQHVFLETLSAVNGLWDSSTLILDRPILSCNDAEQVGW